MKKVLLGLAGLALTISTASAIEDGNYKCIITKISKGKIYKKLDEKHWQIINFTKKDQEISDGTDTFTYNFSDNKIDFYGNKNMMMGVPANDIGKKIFKFAYTINKDNLTLIGWCKNIGKK